MLLKNYQMVALGSTILCFLCLITFRKRNQNISQSGTKLNAKTLNDQNQPITNEKNPLVLQCDDETRMNTVENLRDNLLNMPDYSKPLNLVGRRHEDFSQWGEVPGLVNTYFPGKSKGFFIEAGALNGEQGSNSLYVEITKNWTGLLAEPMAKSFDSLQKKNRKAVTFHGCLDNVCGIEKREIALISGFHSLASLDGDQQLGNSSGIEHVKCASIADILTALEVTHVDWFILDIEGHEVPVLLSFPWETVTLDVLQVEVIENGIVNVRKVGFMRTFMDMVGFVEQPSTRLDMMFTRKSLGYPQRDGFKFGDKYNRQKYYFHRREEI